MTLDKLRCGACQNPDLHAVPESEEWPHGRFDMKCADCGHIVIKGIDL